MPLHVVEVIEHLDPPRLAAFERVVFECARPRTVVVTTPNVEYNVQLRERCPRARYATSDHRFEWSRAEFAVVGARASRPRFGYSVRFLRGRFGRSRGRLLRPRWRSSHGRQLMPMRSRSPNSRSSCSSGRRAPASRPSPGSTSSRPRCSPPTSAAGSSPTTRTARRRPTTPSRCCISSPRKRLAAGQLDRGRRHQRPARGPQAARRTRPRVPLPAGRRSSFDLPEQALPSSAISERPDRDFGPHVIRQQAQQLRRSLRRPRARGLPPRLRVLDPSEDVEAADHRAAAALEQPRATTHGPFDIIGDVHGCCDELERPPRAGWAMSSATARAARRLRCRHPAGTQGRLPRRPRRSRPDDRRASCALVMNMVEAGAALCVPGNHDMKLMRKLRGRGRPDHPRARGVARPARTRDRRSSGTRVGGLHRRPASATTCSTTASSSSRTPGMKESMQGRGSGRCATSRSTARPPARPTSSGSRSGTTGPRSIAGRAMVVYGHTPVPEPEWLNRTHQHRHRLRLRWPAHRLALPGAGARLGSCRASLLRSPRSRSSAPRLRPRAPV